MGVVTFEPQQPFVVDSYKSYEGLDRVEIMEGNSVVMLGKITTTDKYSNNLFIRNKYWC